MTKISPRHAAARRIAEAYPNPLDLQRPEPCAPDTAASLRTAYDAAWEAANAAWDELPADDAARDERALIEELETILARDGDEMTLSSAVAVLDAAPLDFIEHSPEPAVEKPSATKPKLIDAAADGEADEDVFSNLRHIPEAAKTSLAMVLDAAPRRAPRHVHRTPPRDTHEKVAAAAVPPPRRKRRPVLGTVAVTVVLLGGVAGAVLFLDGSGTPAAQQASGTDIPWIRAQTGVPNSLLTRPTTPPTDTAAAAPAGTADGGLAAGAAVPVAEKADERVPQTDAVPPLTNGDVRIVTTQPVTNDAAPAPATPAAEPAAPAGVTATTWVNMRAGAGADEAVVAVVEPGTTVEVISCQNWCEVIVNGQRGFIYNEYLAGLR